MYNIVSKCTSQIIVIIILYNIVTSENAACKI